GWGLLRPNQKGLSPSLWLTGGPMGICTRRLLLLILLVCIGLFSCNPEKVYGIRWNEEDNATAVKKERNSLTHTGGVVSLDATKKAAAEPSPVDPNKMSKRRVRRGSDPIHNRC
ncbi:hypothetical protein GW17_00030787, partial [Ensete ventricosum]